MIRRLRIKIAQIRAHGISVQYGRLDLTMMSAVIALLVVGILMVFSTTFNPVDASTTGFAPFSEVRKHIVVIALGIAALLLVLFLPVSAYKKIAPWSAVASIALLIATLVTAGAVEIMGASRWLDFGFFSLQPSEFVKLLYVFFLASLFEKRKWLYGHALFSHLPWFLLTGVLLVLLKYQVDFGTALILIGLVVIMMIVGKVHWGIFVFLGVAMVIYGTWVFHEQPEKLSRIIAWFNFIATRQGEGYQQYNSTYSIAVGQLFGSGLGAGLQHTLDFFPQAQTDFVFAVAGEELGFVGVVAIVTFYVIIGIRGMSIVRRATSGFEKNLAFLLTLLIIMPAFIHIAVNLALIPAKGLVCPFLSAGGSAMVVSLGAIGILQRMHMEQTAELSDESVEPRTATGIAAMTGGAL